MERQRYYWDDAVGLWAKNQAGHTVSTRQCAVVHEMRRSAWRLVAAGVEGGLDRPEPGRILRNIRASQTLAGEKRGALKWYWEDQSQTDPNSNFFSGLPLCVLRLEFGQALPSDSRDVLEAILQDLRPWFERQTETLDRDLRYPNRSLGDLVCRWLLAEIYDDLTPAREEDMAKAGRYYLDKEWGWGEHLSDIYCKICQYEILALLLYGRRLPAATRRHYEVQYDELLALDKVFRYGPRVPTIRSYSMEDTPGRVGDLPDLLRPLSECIRPWNPKWGAARMYQPLLSLAHRHGFHRPAKRTPRRSETASIPCYGGATAEALVLKDVRAGVMSRYPIMEGIDQSQWGLAWQSFPFCFWHRRGDWGFLQWEVEEEGRVRAHPAHSRRHGNAYLLTEAVTPTILGETCGCREGHTFLALRRMPRLSPRWPWLVDRLRMVAGLTPPQVSREAGWALFQIDFPGEKGRAPISLRMAYRGLEGESDLSLKTNRLSGWDWDARYRWAGSKLPGSVAGLWVLQIGCSTLPSFHREGAACRLAWSEKGGGAKIEYRIDPTAALPAWQSEAG
ncbi:MAG: hypothetical protein HY343_04840 [Lentisphaerae bacterium]|nr:hypothetical protein [Lentisphaerota bacterium]